jgi:hypothetical protein
MTDRSIAPLALLMAAAPAGCRRAACSPLDSRAA